MKIAILATMDATAMNTFLQSVEESINSVGGRLIHVVKSRYPIRLQPVENGKYSPRHMVPSPIRTGDRG